MSLQRLRKVAGENVPMNKCLSFKHSLKAGQLQIGSWITLAHPAIAEIMANTGFQWLAIDLEHSVITIREAEELIRVISLSEVTSLVRLPSNNPDLIKQVLDAGADGIIVPMVKSREDAKKVVTSAYYPPKGVRSVGLARAQQYGSDFLGYKTWLDTTGCTIVVQIEHIDAVKQVESILSLPEVDAYLIGLYDLSASMNLAGEFQHPKVIEAIHYVRKIATQLNKPGGIHIVEPDVEHLIQSIQEGFTFLAYSIDIRMLDVSCRQALARVKKTRDY